MPIQINSPGWTIRGSASRGATRDAGGGLKGLPPEFLADESKVGEEAILVPPAPTRGEAVSPRGLDVSYDAPPGRTAMLAIRHPSGALTFHRPVESATRGTRGPSQVRFQVTLPRRATRGLIGDAIKAIVIEVAKVAADKVVSFVLPKLAEAAEQALWKRRGLTEGWLRVTKDTLAAGALAASTPVSPARSLLFIHGTFSNAAAAYRELAQSTLFERVKDVYGDRIFAFDHFTISRTPEQNAVLLLDTLPEQTTTFDVITHSRGGLVLRNLVERAKQLGDRAERFKLGRAVLVASPNEGTPLATPKRWDETVGWVANLLELFPDNPFTTGAAFVANGIVWLANHASGDLPGLHSMDADGDLIDAIQSPPGPPANAYSALVANYQPTGEMLQRLLDVGIDQFFGSANDLVVPSEGGWRVDRATSEFIPASRIGCFGPGGNLKLDSVTHVGFFSHPETVDFLVNALLGRPQPLDRVDPRKPLPDRRLVRGAATAGVAAGGRAAAPALTGVADAAPMPDEEPLTITVTNGDLTFEREALLLGHYRATRLTGTEAVMDRLLGGTMRHALECGLYPVDIGSNHVFVNARPNLERGTFLPRPKAVIVVGLGEEGKLQAADVVHSVRQAVIAWAQRLAETRAPGVDPKTHPPVFELATTLLASGGTGVGAGEAARLIAQGVFEANALLRREFADGRWPSVGRLRFVELYLDRATEAWRSLRMQEAATPGRYAIDEAVKVGTGPLQRPADSGYRGADYDFITVETKDQKDGEPELFYTLDTRRARSEVRAQRTQSRLLRDLVATASNDQNRDEQIGKTLFNLLVPPELEAYLAGSGEMQIELDPTTARIPWELLDAATERGSDEPWAIRVKLLRKLRIQQFRERVADADAAASVLVIGEPECPTNYPRLYGARLEAVAVRTCLTTGDRALNESVVTGLISADPTQVGSNARTVINALFERPWRIVHIAGHGMPGADGKSGGVVLSNGSFLGPNEIRNMRAVPELVFVNCCHLASGDPDQLLNYDRASFASGVAGALIEIGVRCVIAAGWAVDDEAARVFAEAFYGSLLRGNRFIVAVGEARRDAYVRSPHANTWAAYQCYGDPDWIFQRTASDPNQAAASAVDDFSGVASAMGLKLALERIIVQTKFQGADPARQLDTLRTLAQRFKKTWGRSGSVAELFGEAFVEAGDVEAGMDWYTRAVNAPDGRASMKAAEQLSNVCGRLGWEVVDKAQQHLVAMQKRLDDMPARRKGKSRTAKAAAAATSAVADAQRGFHAAIQRADGLFATSLNLLAKLNAVKKTVERESLVASVFKRRALVDAVAGRRARIREDLAQMKGRYQAALAIGTKSGTADVFYPMSNCLAADVAVNAGAAAWRGLDTDMVAEIEQTLKTNNERDPDFWSVVGVIELKEFEALAKRSLAPAREQLVKEYEDLYRRVKATRMWASVYDTACLILPNYAERVARTSRAEATAAGELVDMLRRFAHPEPDADEQRS